LRIARSTSFDALREYRRAMVRSLPIAPEAAPLGGPDQEDTRWK
jgi:hypothetical protein